MELKRTLGDPWISGEQAVRFLTHCSLGLSSELEELVKAVSRFKSFITAIEKDETISLTDLNGAKVNVVEECGDISWYNSIPKRIFGHTPFSDEEHGAYLESLTAEDYSAIEGLSIAFGIISNETKRALFYGAEVRSAVIMDAVNRIDVCLQEILDTEGIEVSLDHARAVNINKLQARFPLKFDQGKAISRDLENENKIMSASVTPNPLLQ